MKTEMKLFFSKQMLLSTFVAIFLSLNFGVSFASIEATDIQGNKYILNDDGTYKKLDKKGLSNKEVAFGIVAAIKSYKGIYGKEVSDKQASCLNEMILDNAGAKWQNLHFLNQPWANVAQWIEILPMKDGMVTNNILLAQGQINILGAMEAAKEYCEMQ
mgnify:FL=1|jgi:hypothetical protein